MTRRKKEKKKKSHNFSLRFFLPGIKFQETKLPLLKIVSSGTQIQSILELEHVLKFGVKL